MRDLRVTTQGADTRDDGAVAVLVALLLTVFMLLAAFAIDIGAAYAKVRQQSVSADAAALAAAARVGELLPAAFADASCSTELTPAIKAAATQTAIDYNNANGIDGQENATVKIECVTDSAGTSIQVTVNNNHPVKTALAGIIGIDTINANSYAVARYAHVPGVSGLRPWAVCNTVAALAAADKTSTQATALDNGSIGVCGTIEARSWGAVDFDGGNHAAPDLWQWTATGYPGTVSLGPVETDPGYTASVMTKNGKGAPSAFEQLVGQQAVFPVIDSSFNKVTGRSYYNIVNFVTVKVCGVRYAGQDVTTNASGTSTGCWKNPDQTQTSTPQTPVTTPVTKTTTGSLSTNPSLSLTVANPGIFPTDATLTGNPTIEYLNMKVTVTGGWAKKTPVPSGCSSAAATKTLTADATVDSAKKVSLTNATSPDSGWSTTCYDVSKAGNLAVTATWTKKTQLTTIGWTTAAFPDLIPSGSHTATDHIQFKFDSYVPVTSYTGGSYCSFTNGSCGGASFLWK